MSNYTLSSVTSIRILIPIILLLIAFAILLKKKQLNNQQELKIGKRTISIKTVLLILLTIYLLVYIHLTFTYRRPMERAKINLTPFWSYHSAIQFIPFKIKRKWLARQILLNIFLTVPLGLLLPLLYHRTKHPRLWTVITVTLLSILTEALQFFTRRGLCELDDLIDNLLGVVLGVVILSTGSQIMRKKGRTLYLSMGTHTEND